MTSSHVSSLVYSRKSQREGFKIALPHTLAKINQNQYHIWGGMVEISATLKNLRMQR